MGLNSNVSETLAIFERALEQHDTILGTKYLNKRNLFMESSFKAKTNNIRQTETDLCKNFYIEALVLKGSLDLDGVKFKCKRNTCNI